MERVWGKDPSRVVVDEMAGMWVALLAVVPADMCYALAALVFFRLFDIFKPLGIRRMEAVRGGWGILLDDLLAGVYAYISVSLLRNCLNFSQ